MAYQLVITEKGSNKSVVVHGVDPFNPPKDLADRVRKCCAAMNVIGGISEDRIRAKAAKANAIGKKRFET